MGIIPLINEYMARLYLCQIVHPVINLTTDAVRSKFHAFCKNKMDALYLTGLVQKECLHTVYEY